MTQAAVLAASAAAFLVLLALKRVSGLRFCVLCVSVGGTWLALLALRPAGVLDNPPPLALLMGQSIAGVDYLVERRVPEDLLVFRLPFLLTLTALAYAGRPEARAVTAQIVTPPLTSMTAPLM